MAEPNYFKVIRPSTASGSITVKFAPGAGQSTFRVQYRMDGAGDWTQCVGTAVTVSAGHYCEFKGTNDVFYYSSTDWLQLQFTFGRTGSGAVELAGDITTLLNETGGITDLTGRDSCFKAFISFAGTKGTLKLDNLILPSTTLAKSCYEQMFYAVTSPMVHGENDEAGGKIELPAATLAEDSYKNMFLNTQMSYVKAAVKSDELGDTKSYHWLNDIAEAGTFESTDPEFDTSITRSGSTIPEGWTITKPVVIDYLKITCPETNKADISVKFNRSVVAPQAVIEACDSESDNWTTIINTVHLVSPGKTLKIRGAATNTHIGSSPNNKVGCIRCEIASQHDGEEVKIHGDITVLLNGEGGLLDLSDATRQQAFACLFQWTSTTTVEVDCSELKMTSTTLGTQSYAKMFSGLGSTLVKAPTLPAADFTSTSAYDSMFDGCSSLNYLKAAIPSNLLVQAVTQNWLNGVSPVGTFESTDPDFAVPAVRDGTTIPAGWTIKIPVVGFFLQSKKVQDLYINGKQVAELYLNGKKVDFTPPEPPEPDPKLTNFRITNIGNATDNPDDSWIVRVYLPSECDMKVYHSDSGMTEVLTAGEPTNLTLPYGEYLEFEGDNQHGLYPDDDFVNITCSEDGSYEASGQLSSLAMQDTKEVGYSFEGLFSSNGGLTKADNLVIPDGYDGTTETFQSMFHNCTKLVKGPENIPYASGMNMFYQMFNGCSSLTSVGVDWTQWPSASDGTKNWLAYVSAAGTFKCPAALTIPSRDENGVPSGWTIQNA